MYKIPGKVTYYNDYCVAYVDNELAKYYRSMIPKSIRITKQKYDSHLTIVRKGAEFPKKLENWGIHDGQEIEIWYNPVVETCGTYFWLRAISPEVEQIRSELGLPKYRFDAPDASYHITIGNTKNENYCKLNE